LNKEKFFQNSLIEELLEEQNKNPKNYLPPEAIKKIAKRHGKSIPEVYSVASFYPRLSLKPRAKYVIRVCKNLPCHMEEVDKVVEAIKKYLNIDFGKTSPDGLFYLEESSCLGLCSLAPVILINDDIHGKLTPEKVKEILKRYKENN